MKLGICTIQRDRSPWLVEWLAFHYIVGFRKFYFYAHNCSDDSCDKLTRLTTALDMKAFNLADVSDHIQLKAYQNAYDTFGHEVDWMAFIDGDEFLFPVQADSMQDVLSDYNYEKISALAAYWVCFGSNGHIEEPGGLVIDNYTRRPSLDFPFNHHIKSIVRGRQQVSANLNSHLFRTPFGTVDELMRPIDRGYMTSLEPSYQKLRINHYVCQSYSYFRNFKQTSGMADAGITVEREDQWWTDRDINDVEDFEILRFRDRVVDEVGRLEEVLQHYASRK